MAGCGLETCSEPNPSDTHHVGLECPDGYAVRLRTPLAGANLPGVFLLAPLSSISLVTLALRFP